MDSIAFIAAAYKGDLETIQRMLHDGFDPDTRDDNGNLAITAAASNEHTTVVEILLEHGANPNLKWMSSSALSQSVAKRNKNLFLMLMSQPELVKPEILNDALNEATRHGYSDFAALLIKYGANPNGFSWSGNPLFNAVKNGTTEVVKLLLASGADPNLRNHNTNPVLLRLAGDTFYWSSRECSESIIALIENGAEPFAADNRGFSVLTRAAQSGCREVIQAFITGNFPLEKKDNNGLTALEVAIDNNRVGVIEQLFNAGLNMNMKGGDGQPALVRIVTGECYQKKKVLEVFLRWGADPNLRDKQGFTALERAIQNSRKNAVQVLQQLEPNLFGQVDEVPPLSNKQKIQCFPDRKKIRPEKEVGDLIQPLLDELKSLVGLKGIKAEVADLVNYLKVQEIRKQKGFSVPEKSQHIVFMGNPGTGKTTIARLLAQMFKRTGILSRGNIVEMDRAALIGAFINQSARSQQVLEKLLGNVLLIDETYSLTNDECSSDPYGKEAVNVLLKLMEDHRDDLIVIVAGYTEPMQKFIRSNPGLQSRFNKFLHFDDYSPAELTEIFQRFATLGDFKLHPAAELKLYNVFTALYAKRDETFGNARLARNLFEKAINAHANRMVSTAALDEESLVTLYPEDIPNA